MNVAANVSSDSYYVIGTTRTLPPTRPYRYDPGVVIPESGDQPLYAVNIDPKQATRYSHWLSTVEYCDILSGSRSVITGTSVKLWPSP
jgi:hypothetical protein